MANRYVIGIVERSRDAHRWVCKKPSDGGTYVLIQGGEGPPINTHLVIEVTRVKRGRRSRIGRVLWVVSDVLSHLESALRATAWTKEAGGEVWVRKLRISEGEFDAHYFSDNSHSRIAFVPALGSVLGSLRWELSTHLQTQNATEIARAEAVRISSS